MLPIPQRIADGLQDSTFRVQISRARLPGPGLDCCSTTMKWQFALLRKRAKGVSAFAGQRSCNALAGRAVTSEINGSLFLASGLSNRR